MSKELNRDRPAANPGGMVCERCSEVFIGADWHSYCGICVEIVSAEESAFRQRHKRTHGQTQDPQK